jgi:ornithine--oxo-acid transaminase
VEKLKDRGVLTKDTHDVVIRLAPPFVVTPEDLEWALEQVRAVLA